MDERRQARLEDAGFRFGDAYSFLGLNEDEVREVERRLEEQPYCSAKIPVIGMEGHFIPCGRKQRFDSPTCWQHREGFELQKEANERSDN